MVAAGPGAVAAKLGSALAGVVVAAGLAVAAKHGSALAGPMVAGFEPAVA